MSELGLECLHAFVTGGRGRIGSAVVEKLLGNTSKHHLTQCSHLSEPSSLTDGLLRLPASGCHVSVYDQESTLPPQQQNATNPDSTENPYQLRGDIYQIEGSFADERSISDGIDQARDKFGPINILVVAGDTDSKTDSSIAESKNTTQKKPIWEWSLRSWDDNYRVHSRNTFLAIKHFSRSVHEVQSEFSTFGSKLDIENVSIVIVAPGNIDPAGIFEGDSLQRELMRSVEPQILALNPQGRINVVVPGTVSVEVSEGHPISTEADVLNDVVAAVASLASHRAAGSVSGLCINAADGLQALGASKENIERMQPLAKLPAPTIQTRLSRQKKIKVAWSIDFDAVSGLLGTGTHPDNNTADYSAGYFSAIRGVERLLRLFSRLGISDKVTWCIPGHSIETFPEQTKAIIDSGGEIALHGYAHESASQLTAEQERDVLDRCTELVRDLTGGRWPRGYRAPLYQLKERTIALLQERDFLWDSSLSHDDSKPYFLPLNPAPIKRIDFDSEKKASTWMHPSPDFSQLQKSTLVEIPCNWYAEDMTPLQFFHTTPNSAGYVDVRTVERMWQDRFEWLMREIEDEASDVDKSNSMTVYSIVIHPDTSGMAHVIGMVERFLKWILDFGDRIEFRTYSEIAEEFRGSEKGL